MVSLRVPALAESQHGNSDTTPPACGALGSGLAHVHLAMYPLWGSSGGNVRPQGGAEEPTVTHYLALLVNLDAQLPHTPPHPTAANQSGARGAGGGGAGTGGGSGGGDLPPAPHPK